jgi:hypothetical protein
MMVRGDGIKLSRRDAAFKHDFDRLCVVVPRLRPIHYAVDYDLKAVAVCL